MDFLNGKKTYIVAGAAAITLFLGFIDVITPVLTEQILVLLGFGGLAALRHGVTK